MQRRAGNKIFWEMISFTGSFAPEFLRQALERRSGGAVQPAANPAAKARAYEARTQYRLGLKFSRIRERHGPRALRDWQRELADGIASGELVREVNATTRGHGHGRLRTIVAFWRQRPQAGISPSARQTTSSMGTATAKWSGNTQSIHNADTVVQAANAEANSAHWLSSFQCSFSLSTSE